jgi:hypothetical protein
VVKFFTPISLKESAVATALLLGAFLLCEVPPLVSAICSVVVAIQTMTGMALYQRYLGAERAAFVEALPMSFVLGSALAVFSALILRPVVDPSFGWLFPTVVLAVYIAKKPLRIDLRANSHLAMSTPEVVAVVSIAFLYLAQDSHWPTAIATTGLCVYCLLVWRFESKIFLFVSRAVLVTGALATIVLGVNDRPPFWDYLTDDFRVFESLSRSIWNFGPQDPFGTLGTIGAQYHISTYAYSGLLDRFSGASTFIVLNRVMLILTALMLSSIIWAFIKRDGGTNRIVNLLLASMFPLFFDYSFTSPSFCFGLLFFLTSVYFWTDQKVDLRLLPRVFIGFLLTSFVITTKISNMPVVLSGLALMVLYALIAQPPWRNSAAVNFVVTFLTTGIYFVLFLANGRTSSQLDSMYAFGYARRIAGDLVTVGDAAIRIPASIMYTSLYLVLPMVAVIYFLLRQRKELSPLLVIAIPALPLVVLTALFGGADASGYFVLSCLGILNLVLITSLSKFFSDFKFSDRNNRQISLFALLAGVTGIASQQMVSYFNGGTANEVLIRSFLKSHWVSALLLTIIWFAILKLMKIDRRIPFIVAFITAELLAFAWVEAMNLDRLTKGPELRVEEASTALGTTDEISVGIWIRNNTELPAIIATNHFCGAACSGENWFENDYQNLDDSYLFPPSPTGYGTFNFILSAYAERRFFIEGARFLLVNGMPKEQVRERMNLVLEFANTPDAGNLRSLQEKGVDYFVVDKESTSVQNWKDFATTRYENDTFLVLELL